MHQTYFTDFFYCYWLVYSTVPQTKLTICEGEDGPGTIHGQEVVDHLQRYAPGTLLVLICVHHGLFTVSIVGESFIQVSPLNLFVFSICVPQGIRPASMICSGHHTTYG